MFMSVCEQEIMYFTQSFGLIHLKLLVLDIGPEAPHQVVSERKIFGNRVDRVSLNCLIM